MRDLYISLNAIIRLTTATVAMTGLVACTSSPALVAGATSSHVPQSYQTNTSTANVTSTLSGSSVVVPLTGLALAGTPRVAHRSGTINHQSGAITLSGDGHTFTDVDGPTSSGFVTDGSATGYTHTIGSGTASYDYVKSFSVNYPVGGQRDFTRGYAGIVTAAPDIPTAGSAGYTGTGTASFVTLNKTGSIMSAATTNLSQGNTTVNVDFAARTATVDMRNFSSMKDGNDLLYLVGAEPINQVHGTGLTVTGAQLSGGTWALLKDGTAVTPLGASTVATSDGAFYGYDPTISAPDEVAGTVLITGATQFGFGTYAAD